MLQQENSDDFVIATGLTHSVREMVQIAFERVGLNYLDHVTSDETMLRQAEVAHLVGDPSKAQETLGWQPEVGFRELIEMMVDADLELVEQESRRDTTELRPTHG